MKKVVASLGFVLSVYLALGQQIKNSNISYQESILKSEEAFKKALLFQNMPQYNEDSTGAYFNKAEKLLKLHVEANYKKLAQIYFAKCNYLVRIYNYSKMDSVATLGYQFLENIPAPQKDYVFEYRYLFNWAKIKLESGELNTSLKLFSKALSVSENVPSESLSLEILKDKGIFYRRYNLESERKLTLGYLKKSYVKYVKKGIRQNATSLYAINREIIGCYTSDIITNIDSVFHYFNKLQQLLKYIKNPNIYAWYHCTYGRQLITTSKNGAAKISENQYLEGRQNILKSLAILKKYRIENTTIEPFCYGLLADLNMQEGKFDAAVKNYKQSRALYLKAGSRYGAGDILGYISTAFEKRGNLDSALKYQKQYHAESIKFETERNQRTVRESELQINVLKQDKELKKKQNQVYVYVIALIIFSLIFGLLFWNFRIKQKTNRKLESKNKLLDKRNLDNELLMREIHHRVKNNLEIISGLLGLQSAQINDLNTKEAITQGQNRVNSISIVHQKLYQGTQLGAIEMKDYLLNLSESIMDSFGIDEQISLNLEMDNLDLDIDTAIPLGLIVNELFTNAVKYAFPNKAAGIITIKLEKQLEQVLFLNFRDNGVGKADDVKGTGFGSQLISLLTRQLNGKMKIINQNGTSISFLFKLKA